MAKRLYLQKILHMMSLEKFDPDGVGVRNAAYFGMPFSVSEAALALISVPWDVTSSYGGGSSGGPVAMIEASVQLDFYDPWAPDAWQRGIATVPVGDDIWQTSNELRAIAEGVIDALENGYVADKKAIALINKASEKLNARIFAEADKLLSDNKLVGIVGGDHSTPLGLIKALGKKHESFGILHLDAHCDLREKYEGFEHSHASIMFNILRDVPAVSHLVQVGLRDYSKKEYEFARNNQKIRQFTGDEIAKNHFRGVTWAEQCTEIVNALPSKVYISFDIDFLSPEFCPGTGTPVPGGRTFDEAVYLIAALRDSGRRIIGFDLCEVSPQNPIDAQVGARMLFKLCGQILNY